MCFARFSRLIGILCKTTVALPKGEVHVAAFYNVETGPLTNRLSITDAYVHTTRSSEVQVLQS